MGNKSKGILAPILVLLCFVIWGIPVASAATISTSSSTSISNCQNCQSTITTQIIPYSVKPGQFLNDFGPISYSTSLSGFSLNDSSTEFLSIGLPSIGGIPCLASSIFFNSSTTLLQCGSVNDYFTPQGYSTINIISGTVISSTTISLLLSSTAKPAICDSLPHQSLDSITGKPITIPACTEADFGNLGFNWAADGAFSPSYDNSTHILTFSVSGAFVIKDPLFLDGAATNCSSASGTNHTCNLTLTTSNANDVIIVKEDMLVLSVSYCQLPTATGVTFHLRVKTTASGTVFDSCEYYTTWSSSGSLTITCNWNNPSSGSTSTCSAFGISGANTANPYDPNGSSNCTAGAANAAGPATCNISTSNANDMLIGLAAGNSINTYTQGTGFTQIQANCANVLVCNEYKVVSSTQSGTAVTITFSPNTQYWTMIGDAIQQAIVTVTQPIKINTLPAGAPSGTITITGCSPSPNSSITGNGNTHSMTMNANCSYTLSASGISGNTRYEFNCSAHPNPCVTITPPNTCASGTCSTYSNSTTYQLRQNYTATPVGPIVWNVAVSFTVNGTFFGASNSILGTGTTSIGGGVVSINKVWADYNLATTVQSPIDTNWNAFPAGTNVFTETTGGHVNNVNYVMPSSSAGAIFGDFLIAAIVLGFMASGVFVARRRR